MININFTITLSVPCLFNKLTIFHYQVFLQGYSSFNFANWELDFLFLLLFLCFFSLMTSSSTKISKSTSHKSQKFVTIHISEICHCFHKINFLSDMARIVEHYITPSLLSIILFTIVLGQWEHKNFYSKPLLWQKHIPIDGSPKHDNDVEPTSNPFSHIFLAWYNKTKKG